VDGTFRLYSRSQENHSEKYPDVIKRLPARFAAGVQDFIVDSEV
jgi:ATP-dependent DNA ligase